MRRLRTLPPASTARRAQHSPARCSEPEPRLRGAHRGGAAAPQGPRSSEQLGGPHFLWGARAFPATPPALLPVSEVRAWGGADPPGVDSRPHLMLLQCLTQHRMTAAQSDPTPPLSLGPKHPCQEPSPLWPQGPCTGCPLVLDSLSSQLPPGAPQNA